MMLKVIWDLDGTLIDSAVDVVECLELAINESGVDISRQIKPFAIGATIDVIFKESFPPEMVSNEITLKVIKAFRRIYDNSDFNKTKPFPGINEIIQDTANFEHHIVTNKPDMPTKRIINKLNWSRYISGINTPYTIPGEIRLKQEIFKDIVCKNGGEYVGIGDTKNDCLAAKKSKITAVGILWGTGTREDLTAYCDFVFENTKQLKNFLYGS